MSLDDWTDTDAEKLSELWNDGFTALQIGAHLGRSRNAVLGKVRRMGINRPRPYREVVEKPRASIRGANVCITKEQLTRMRAANMGQYAIAKSLGVCTGTVRYWLVKYGLPLKLEMRKFSDQEINEIIARWEKHKS